MKKFIPAGILLILVAGLLIIPRLKQNKTVPSVKEPTMITVEIEGEIHLPGVYEVVTGTTLEALINYALGTTAHADLTRINQATLLEHGVKYTIPIKNQTTIEKLNINQATLAELMTLPGIGQVTAQKIIDFRTTQGFFMKLEDLTLVSGIGAQTFEKLKRYITL